MTNTDPKILSAVAAIVRPTFRTADDPLPHPDETALVHRLAAFVESVLDSHAAILEDAYSKGWNDCKNVAMREMAGMRSEFAADFAADQLAKMRQHAAAYSESHAKERTS